MSVNSVLGSAVSGLLANQTAMRITANNIANVHTPGYARSTAEFAAKSLAGIGAGVDIADIRRVADQYLQRASMQATAQAAGAARSFDMLNRMQAQFGTMDNPGSLFARLDGVLGPLAQLAASPSSQGDRAMAVSAIQSALDEVARLSGETRALRAEADVRIAGGVARVNELLADLEALNDQIARGRLSGDSTGAENAQAALLNELSQWLDVRVAPKPGGGVEVRSPDGQLLLGLKAGSLEYAPAHSGDFGIAYSQIVLRPAAGVTPVPMNARLGGGELSALIALRDQELPAISAQLGELAAGYADALNAAHNAAASVPAPGEMSGRQTGLLASDALGFTGAASIGVTAADGTLSHRIDIDFDAGTLSVDGGPAVAFGATIGDFVTALNAQLGPLGGSADFTDGRLSLSAGAGEGLVIQQSDSAPSDRAGRGLSHFFGLNDVVDSSRPGFFETGLSGTDAHGFAPGQELRFRVSSGAGAGIDVTIAVGGTTLNDLLSQLNNPGSGLGNYASFSLGADGSLIMTPAPGGEHLRVELAGDTTRRGGTNVSFSQLFGLGEAARAGRATIYEVRTDIAANPARLSVAAPDIRGAALGDHVLGAGDGRGALALHAALNASHRFGTAGSIGGGTMSVSDYAARLAGDIGARAARAERALDTAHALKLTADERRSAVEGVNMDEELALMVMYQQSYNASARLMQAAREMTDVLLNMV